MKKMFLLFNLIIICTLIWFVFKPVSNFSSQTLNKKETKMQLKTVFANNEEIPSIYTCDGKDLAPKLTISDVPANAKSLVLIVDDPDAPMKTWVHWILYNIPVSTIKIDAENLSSEIKQGMTDFKRTGWGGPCPPSGTHRYFFKLYAIDKILDINQGASKSEIEKEIEGHIIEKSEIIGIYKRK
jgi:Raf kinase inhibitor-like YbhB/YbcL family protein